MGLYDNAYPSVYEEIKRFYPVWYWDVLEMDAIWRAQGHQLHRARDAVEALIADQYVATADAATIAALEEFLGISQDASRTMNDRRQLVAALLSGDSHIGATEIKVMVAAFTEGAIEVYFDHGDVAVEVTRELSERFNQSDCALVLYSRLPAHLSLLFIDITKPILFVNEPDDLSFHRFKMSAAFSNARGSGVVVLDGSVLLDGSINLDQAYSGISMPYLTITTDIPHGEDLTGSIVIDSWWTLDGVTALDGSKLLNARYIKEEL